jgi:hypothetical protein
MFGVGGGILIVPMLTGIYRLTQHQAHGTSLAVVGGTALFSVVVYALHGNVAWLVGAATGLTSAVAARWGARLAARTSAERLTRAFAVLLIVVAIRMAWGLPAATTAFEAHGLRVIAVGLAIGIGAGLLAGYMGVGGGVIAVPAFTMLLGMPQQVAQGTSLAVILVTAPFGALEHHRHGNVVMKVVPALALGAAAGAPLASLLVQRLPQELLARGFAIFLAANAIHLWLRASRRRSTPGR